MLCVRVLGFFSDRRGESGKYRSTQRLSLPISCSWTSFQAQLPRRIQPQATPAPLSLLLQWAAGSPHLQGWQQQCFSSSLAWCRPDLYATPPRGSMGTFQPSWDNWFTWSLPYATSCEAPNWEFWFASFFLFISFFQVYINGFFSLGYIYISWIMLLRTSCNNPVWWCKYIHNPKKRRGEGRDKLEWNWESYLWSPLVIHWVLPPPMVGTRSVSLHAHEWALLLPYTVYSCHGRYPTADPQLFGSDM